MKIDLSKVVGFNEDEDLNSISRMKHYKDVKNKTKSHIKMLLQPKYRE